MTTGISHHGTHEGSREHLNQLRAAQVEHERRRRRRIRFASVGAAVAVIAVVVAMMLDSRQESSSATRVAPDFTLSDTSGTTVSLAALRGKDVLLYFSEGAGCQACLVQMAQIEKDPGIAAAGLTVLPIVMNTREQITTDMAANGVRTPFLLDDGTASQAYGTLGKGMHADLPGHSFVLIDRAGNQRWYGEYPSMWLSTADLLKQVRAHLTD
jgi:peroxiredoxin